MRFIILEMELIPRTPSRSATIAKFPLASITAFCSRGFVMSGRFGQQMLPHSAARMA